MIFQMSYASTQVSKRVGIILYMCILSFSCTHLNLLVQNLKCSPASISKNVDEQYIKEDHYILYYIKNRFDTE